MTELRVESQSPDTYERLHVPGHATSKYNKWECDDIDAVLDQVREILENSLSGIYCINVFNDQFKPERPESKKLTADQIKLITLMSAISEDCYAVGWMSGNEFRLWSMLERDILVDGAYRITPQQRNEMMWLSRTIDGWIYYDKTLGPLFIGMEVWKHKYEMENEKK